jgi:hypothetical protein
MAARRSIIVGQILSAGVIAFCPGTGEARLGAVARASLAAPSSALSIDDILKGYRKASSDAINDRADDDLIIFISDTFSSFSNSVNTK